MNKKIKYTFYKFNFATSLAGVSILIPILIIYLYSNSNKVLSFSTFELKKYEPWEKDTLSENLITKRDTAFVDSTKTKPIINKTKEESKIEEKVDTTKYRILLIGDSQVDGLRGPLNDYCVANGHKIILCLQWYSATIFNFAKEDTLDALIKKYKPSYIIMVVGLNEVWAKDIKPRKASTLKVLNKFGSIPYSWIGPANWTEDYGINEMYQNTVDQDCFFLSKNLELPRFTDGRHPNKEGYAIWMEAIAEWIQTKARYPLPLKNPAKKNSPLKFPLVYLHAGKTK